MNFDEADPNFKADIQKAIIEAADVRDILVKESKNIENRARFTNLTRRVHSNRIHDEYYDKNIQTILKQKNYCSKVQADLKLAKEIDKQKEEEIKFLKMRQLVRENSPELRELESKLRSAYAAKELAAQLAEKEHYKNLEKQEKKMHDDMMNVARTANLVAEKQEKEENKIKQIRYKNDLQDQMIMKHQLKENMYEEFLKEKKYIDYIIQRIYDEDQREMEEKMCKMKKTREEIEAFKKAQQIWREREKKEIAEENERMELFLKEKERKEKAIVNDRRQKEAQHVQLVEQLGKRIYEEIEEKRAREAFLLDLQEEEMKQMEIDKRAAKIKRQIQENLEVKQTRAIQVEERRKREEQEKIEDIQYKEQLWAKMVEDKKLEQLSAEKRRRKMIEMRHEIEDAMQEHRAKRAEETRRLLLLDQEMKNDQEKKRQIIEEERIRMLKEHAENLIGYFPPGLLRETDLPHLGADIVKPNYLPCQ